MTVVAPTEHLKKQWAEAAARIGIKLDPEYSAGPLGREYHGVAITYAGVGVRPMLHRNRIEQRKTLVILDEIHHAGDSKSWGEACLEAFEPATRRLALTGTPFRSDTNPIPFVTYEEGNDGIRRSSADYTYGYGNALADGVVRPVIFLSYSGNMRWRTKAGDEIAARLGEPMTKDAVSQAWRTALDPRGDWMPNVLRAADQRLTEVRKGIPDAGAPGDRLRPGAGARVRQADPGDHRQRRHPGALRRHRRLAAHRRLRALRATAGWSRSGWCPRASTCRGWRSACTPRPSPRRCSSPRPWAASCAPASAARRPPSSCRPSRCSWSSRTRWRSSATTSSTSRRRTARRTRTPSPRTRWTRPSKEQDEDTGEQEQFSFEALESEAVFDRVLYDGAEFGMQAHAGSEEEQDYLGIPGLLEPDQVQMLLQKRQARQIAHSKKRPDAEADLLELPAERRPVVTHKELLELRKQLNTLVGAYVHQSGKPHGVIHTELRRVCGGPPSAEATAGQLRERIKKVQEWATRMR